MSGPSTLQVVLWFAIPVAVWLLDVAQRDRDHLRAAAQVDPRKR